MPLCICLQETHLKPNENFLLRAYDVVRKDAGSIVRAKGGVAFLINQNVPYQTIPLRTSRQAIAIRLHSPLKITICNIYLPEFDWQLEDLTDLIDQLPTPVLFLGDFNAHNPLWGSNFRDTSGRIIEKMLENTNLIYLNTGEGTYFSARNGNTSAIDLTFSSPSTATQLQWTIVQN